MFTGVYLCVNVEPTPSQHPVNAQRTPSKRPANTQLTVIPLMCIAEQGLDFRITHWVIPGAQVDHGSDSIPAYGTSLRLRGRLRYLLQGSPAEVSKPCHDVDSPTNSSVAQLVVGGASDGLPDTVVLHDPARVLVQLFGALDPAVTNYMKMGRKPPETCFPVFPVGVRHHTTTL